MGTTLTLIDHHQIPDPDFIHNPKVTVVFGYDHDNYFENIKPHINKQFDYVFMDENPDAMIAATLYLRSREIRPQFKCLPRALNENDFNRLKKAGLNHIVFFNNLWAYDSAIDEVDTVFLINPHESGLQNISASHLLYESIPDTSNFTRDLAGVAAVMDYTMDEAFDLIVDIVSSYPDTFADLAEMIKNITLNKYNVGDSVFGEITSMFRAPSILYGVKGVDNVVQSLVENPPFTLQELLNGTDNSSVQYLLSCAEKYKEIFDQEMALFEEEKEAQDRVIIYAPHYKSQNFVREFSNRIKDKNIHSIIMIKTPTDDNRTKYSIRRGELKIDLGAVLSDMGVGGGNPFAAGCTVSDPVSFEKEF
ncbi:DHH family phosphoesterase, partial [candidate division KSB1 bacterium]